MDAASRDFMEETTTQSAAESEEDLVLLQQEHQLRHTAASSAFSTSSVDRFLRDNGFQIDEDAGLDDVLSSSADGDFTDAVDAMATMHAAMGAQQARGRGDAGRDDDVFSEHRDSDDPDDTEAAVAGLLRGEPIAAPLARADECDGGDDVLSSDGSGASSTAAGEGDLPTPRFILLDDEDLMSVSKQAGGRAPPRAHTAVPPADSGISSIPSVSGSLVLSREWRGHSPMNRPAPRSAPAAPMRLRSPARRTDQGATEQESFDHSLLLGGSGLSALSEENASTTSLSRRPDSERASQAIARGDPGKPASRLHVPWSGEKVSDPQGSGLAPSSSSSSSSAEESNRVQDDELSDALGVGSTLREKEAPSSQYRRRSSHAAIAEDEVKEDEHPPALARNVGDSWFDQSNSQRRDVPTDIGVDYSTQKDDWADVNILLRKNGLPTLHLIEVTVAEGAMSRLIIIPAHGSLVNLVQDYVLQIDRKNQIIQDLVIDSNRTSKVQNRAEGDLAFVERKSEEFRRSLHTSQAEIKRLQEELRRQKEDTERQVKALKGSCLKLQQQLKVSEHRVKAKEVLVERIQKKLQQQVDKESLNKARDRKAFKQLQQRDARKANEKDNHSLEFINVYETQREQMQEEIEQLRSQVADLNGELRDMENSSTRHSSIVDSTGSKDENSRQHNSARVPRQHGGHHSSDEMLERLEAARREQEHAASRLRLREAAMIKKISAIEDEMLIAREVIAELKEENANLSLEAESRPSIRDYRLSQRRIHQLERQLSENKLALEEANDISELRKFMGTKDLVERDRLNHRLHLNRLDTLPRETLLEVVKEVCRVLNLTDITLITPSLHKLCNVVTAVPRMEKFIRDVCGFVYFQIEDRANQAADSKFELEQVLPTLQHWMSERKTLYELEGFKAAIMSELCKRSIEPSILGTAPSSGQLPNLPRAVHIVAELVELEKSVYHHREIYMEAASELERRPSVLINQIVRHFSHLFQVKSIEGVLPKINAIYLLVNEVENFLKVIRSILDLRPETSIPACIDAIRERLEGNGGEQQAAKPNEDENPQGEKNFVIGRSRASGDGNTLPGVRQVREMSILVRDLKKELGAATIQEILPRTKRLMELLSMSIHNSPIDERD